MIPGLDPRHPPAGLNNLARHLVPDNPGIRHRSKLTMKCMNIGTANPHSPDPDQHAAVTGHGHGHLDQPQIMWSVQHCRLQARTAPLIPLPALNPAV